MADSTVTITAEDAESLREFLRSAKIKFEGRCILTLQSKRGDTFIHLESEAGAFPTIATLFQDAIKRETELYELHGKPYGEGLHHQLWWNRDYRNGKVNRWKHLVLSLCFMR